MFASMVTVFWSAFEYNVADVISIQHFQNKQNISRVKVKLSILKVLFKIILSDLEKCSVLFVKKSSGLLIFKEVNSNFKLKNSDISCLSIHFPIFII